MSPRAVLIGMPGSGKTTVGMLLAERLGTSFVDADLAIEQRTGLAITDIFDTRGEQGFREIERDVTLDLLTGDGVVSLGGGAVTIPEVREALCDHQTVWLDVSVVHATRRVGMNRLRPLLLGDVRERLQGLLDARLPLYEQASRFRIETDGLRPTEVVDAIVAALDGSSEGAIRVATAQPYDVHVGRGVRQLLTTVIPDGARAALIHPTRLTPQAEEAAASLGDQAIRVEVPDGEAAKSASVLAYCWDQLADARFTRSDIVVGLGGGATTDLAGFVAATWLRGVGYVAMPSTILGMADAAVGGKTGIDLAAGKNLVGAFHEPLAVLADLDFLDTLPEREVASGMAEVVKCGFIRDPQILRLVADGDRDQAIRHAIQVKADVVAADLRERTSHGDAVGREALNYGHTLGHAIEAYESYRMRHGEAVALGAIFAAEVAARLGHVDDACPDQHRAAFGEVGLATTYANAPFDELRDLMRVDKKSRGNSLRLVVLDGEPGRVRVVQDPNEAILRESYAALA